MIVQRKKEVIIKSPDVELIPLSDNVAAVIDADDYPVLGTLHWSLRRSHNLWYAVTRKQIAGKRKYIKMHRLITSCPDGYEVHHINGNTLDNRKSNLMVLQKKDHLAIHNRFTTRR